MASSPDEAVEYANRIGYPVALKIVSEKIIHKVDIKGVLLNIGTDKDVREGYKNILANAAGKIPESDIKGILVTKMIPGGSEVIIGIKRDENFGPVIMYGLGGIFVEIFEDVSFRIAPVTDNEIEKMVMETRSSKLLTGARGSTPKDLECLFGCLKKISQFAIDFPQIKELDINPLILQDKKKGCFIADAKIMI
jgi:acyl-CoA synthetase (NDP forming)